MLESLLSGCKKNCSSTLSYAYLFFFTSLYFLYSVLKVQDVRLRRSLCFDGANVFSFPGDVWRGLRLHVSMSPYPRFASSATGGGLNVARVHLSFFTLASSCSSSDPAFFPLGKLVGSSGLEPPTSRLSGVRSNHLSYEPMLWPLPLVLLPSPGLPVFRR